MLLVDANVELLHFNFSIRRIIREKIYTIWFLQDESANLYPVHHKGTSQINLFCAYFSCFSSSFSCSSMPSSGCSALHGINFNLKKTLEFRKHWFLHRAITHLWLKSYRGQYYWSYKPYKYKTYTKLNIFYGFLGGLFLQALQTYVHILVISYGIFNFLQLKLRGFQQNS